MDEHLHLSRREREIMDIVYARGEATATHVRQAMADPPTRTAVRTMMGILEEKGHLKHHKHGREFVYTPTRPRARAGQSDLARVVDTFFDSSLEKAVSSHLLNPRTEVSADELKRLAQLIREARKQKGNR
jgi:predicted transcriptional regulator